MRNLGDIAERAGIASSPGESPDKLYREDRCSCSKPEGVFGSGPWHLRRSPDHPHSPPSDLVVERCPEYTRTFSQLGEWKRALRGLEQEMADLGEETSASYRRDREGDILAQIGDAKDRIAECERGLKRLKGTGEMPS